MPTPKKLLNKNAIINPQNKDNKFFFYMQLRYLLIMMKSIKSIQVEFLKIY